MRGLISPLKMASGSTPKISPSSFSKFMTGGKGIGGSSLGEASNNVVNFSRATSRPITPDFSSLIGSITNTVNVSQSNTTQNIFQTVNRTLSDAIGSLRKEFQGLLSSSLQRFSKESQVSTTKNIVEYVNNSLSSAILPIRKEVQTVLSGTIQKFTANAQGAAPAGRGAPAPDAAPGLQSLSQNALDFANFFGDPRTNKRIEGALKSLRSIFDKSFEASVKIRQIIGKITKQLSNLPTASGNAGSLDLNVSVPGNYLRQTGNTATRNFARTNLGRNLGLGVGIGMGGFGIGMMASNMMNAKRFQEEKLSGSSKAEGAESSGGMIPEDFVNTFESVLKNLGNSLNNLINYFKSREGGGLGQGQGQGQDNNQPGQVVSTAPGEEKLAAFTATLESSDIQDQADVFQSMLNRAGQNYGGKGGLAGQLTGYNQYSPISAVIHGTTDPDAQSKYGPISAKLGNTPEERIAKLLEISNKPDGLSELQKLFGAGNAQNANKLLQDFKSQGELSKESQSKIRGRTDFGAEPDKGGAQGGNLYYRGNQGSSNYFGGVGADKAPSTLSGASNSNATSTSQSQSQSQATGTARPAPPRTPDGGGGGADENGRSLRTSALNPSTSGSPSVAVVPLPAQEPILLPSPETAGAASGNSLFTRPGSNNFSGQSVAEYRGTTFDPNLLAAVRIYNLGLTG